MTESLHAAASARMPTDPAPRERWAHRLGYAGLTPFALLAALVWLVDAELRTWVAVALVAYAGLIASFMGGVHWGVAWLVQGPEGIHQGEPGHATAQYQNQRQHLVWGVVPSLWVWPALVMPPHAGLPLVGFVLIACYAVDRKLYPRAGLQRWLTLRFRLTAVAALCCFLAVGGL